MDLLKSFNRLFKYNLKLNSPTTDLGLKKPLPGITRLNGRIRMFFQIQRLL